MYKCSDNNDCDNDFLCCASCKSLNECQSKNMTCYILIDCVRAEDCPYSKGTK